MVKTKNIPSLSFVFNRVGLSEEIIQHFSSSDGFNFCHWISWGNFDFHIYKIYKILPQNTLFFWLIGVFFVIIFGNHVFYHFLVFLLGNRFLFCFWTVYLKKWFWNLCLWLLLFYSFFCPLILVVWKENFTGYNFGTIFIYGFTSC